LLHLLLFAFRPKTLENLFFALFASSVVGLFACEVQMNSESDLSRVLWFHNWFITFSITMALSALLVEYRVFWKRIGHSFYLLSAVALILLAWAWTRDALSNLLPVMIFVAVVYAESLRLAVKAIVQKKPDAWVVGAGFLVFTMWIFLSTLRGLGWIDIAPELVAATGLGILALSFSVYLTRQIARTNQQLETKLTEVESLTAQTIEQERRAAREEAERLVLQADNARKTAELEEARQLQLAMLPKVVPKLRYFDLAVHMTTAHEVGGDYYDFHTNGSDSCTVVVGDATGHGLHAGMVVGVAKSLFQSWCREPDLGNLLKQIGDGLGSMHRRQASMAMVLLRLASGGLRFASAGMPPLLVWRHASQKIDEILAPNVPLGTLSDIDFPENHIAVAPGDSVLIMTDGLAELTDPEGEPLGYDRAARIFSEVAHLDPESAIEALLEAANDYLEGTPLQDDMTLVLLRARG
jgi:serine phosphatase RsbU (regulator of sigma subunit)